MRNFDQALAAAVLAMGLSGTALAQEKPVCPHGEAGGWQWRATMNDIVVENPDQPLVWKTIDGEKTSKGVEIRVASLYDLDKVSSVTLYAEPPTIDLKRESSDYTYRFFNKGSHIEGGQGILPQEISYFLMGVDSTGGEDKHFMSGRIERADQDEKTVQGGWLAKGQDDDLGWHITEVGTLRIVIATQDFKPAVYGQPKEGYDNIAVSDAIDLSPLADVWNGAIAARNAESERAYRENITCKPPARS
ncbi:hypothetical protein WNY37_01015 [Henriciella sp. AS95]|uniref:hypothetical protein n=1 Tax=Henriciella sp. AS95 TaxID=3135782 RepID=UPI00316D2881